MEIILSGWFDNQEESFHTKKTSSNTVLLRVETSCPPVENLTETSELFVIWNQSLPCSTVRNVTFLTVLHGRLWDFDHDGESNENLQVDTKMSLSFVVCIVTQYLFTSAACVTTQINADSAVMEIILFHFPYVYF